jgi:hypothetical protein
MDTVIYYLSLIMSNMKRNFRISVIASFLLIAPMLLLAQAPPHPNGGNAPGSGNGPVGGGAPLGDGLYILIAFALLYGIVRWYTTIFQKRHSI